MITTQDKVDLFKRIVEIEDMNLCSTDFVKKVTSPISTPSDRVLDNYPNNGNIKLDNCFVCIDRTSIILHGVVQFYSEEFDYRDENKIGKRFVGYCNNSIKIVIDNIALTNSLKLFFLVHKNDTANIFNREPYQRQDFQNFIWLSGLKVGDTGFTKDFYDKTIMVNWTTFKKLCDKIPIDDDWTEWFNYNIRDINFTEE